MSSKSYDLNALMRAAALGAVVLLVLAVISQIDCIGFIAACGTIFVLAGIGWTYGRLARQKGVQADIVPSALFGGLAAALASVIPVLLTATIDGNLLCAPFVVFIALIPAYVFGAVGGTLYGMANS